MKMSEKKSMKKAKKGANRGAAKKAQSLKGREAPRAKRRRTDTQAIFMQNILDKRKELEETLERLIDNQKEYDLQFRGGDLIDELDQAQREISASSYYPIIERKIRELRRIDLLIKRMSKQEKFGLCEECGKRIPKKRLLIVPDATLCVSCQRELEKARLWGGIEAKPSIDYGERGGTDWNSDGSDEKAHRTLMTQMNRFSINDIQGTETDNELASNIKVH
ncbi:MAG: TraR/DksA family transcriptional regulator [Desulfobacteraceae bacterium]|jgi:DnaK suppressor protein